MERKQRVDETTDTTTRGRKFGPRQRVDIATVEDPTRRKEIIAFAQRIQALVELQAQDQNAPSGLFTETAFELSMREDELRQKVQQFVDYHQRYAGEHPANAFTPVKRETTATTVTNEGGTERQARNPIRRRPHLASIDDLNKQKKYIDEAWEYYRLNEEEDVYGRVQPGNLTAVARKLGMSRDCVEKQRTHLRKYHQEYPDDPIGTSVVPLPRGPQKGRLRRPCTNEDAHRHREEIIRDVEAAYLNHRWLSRDGDEAHSTENYSLIEDNPLCVTMIYKLIRAKYGPIVSKSTIWRIINDFRERHPIRIHAAREGINDARQNFFPHIDNNVSGPGERIQIDIRPLQCRVKSQEGLDTTVYVAWIIDDFSRAVLAYNILTRKTLNAENDVIQQDFSAKQIRQLIARYIIDQKKRPRIIYVDRGAQFGESLKKYLLLLTVPGEDATQLIHRKGARGGGKVERDLQLIDSFLKFRKGYVRSTNYRESYRRTRTTDLQDFDQFKTDFDTFVHHRNHDLAPDGGASRWQQWQAGPDKSLSPPSTLNLAAFAGADRHEYRKWDGSCFQIDKQKWVPAEPSKEVYEKLADAKHRGEQIHVIVCTIGDHPVLFFKLSDEIEWMEAIPKGQSNLSNRKHRHILNSLQSDIERENDRNAREFFDRVINGDPEGPLVIDGLSRTPDFIRPKKEPPHSSNTLPADSSSFDGTDRTLHRSGSSDERDTGQLLESPSHESVLGHGSQESPCKPKDPHPTDSSARSAPEAPAESGASTYGASPEPPKRQLSFISNRVKRTP